MSQQTVNPSMVTLARESRGITQTELAKIIGVSQALLSKIESGVKPTTESILGEIAKALDYPENFFFQTDTLYGPSLGEFFHRRRQDISVKVIARVHAQINIIMIHIERLLRSVDLPPIKIHHLDLNEFGGRPHKVAAAVRAMLQIADGPIPNVIRLIENAGGIVVRYPFGTPQIDAIGRWVPNLPPLFFVNESLTTDRERMSLCHELGHFVMHDVPNAEMETEANQFAASFLMPEQDIAPHLTRISLDRLSALKPYWRVSMGALLYRATELKKVPASIAKLLWVQMAQRGYRRREPSELDLASEEATVLRDILELHRTHYGYDMEEFSKVLAARPAELMALYKLAQSPTVTRPPLRLLRA